MQKIDIPQFLKIVRLLWPSYKIPEDKVLKEEFYNLIINFLEPYKLDLIIEATKMVARTNDFFSLAKVCGECENLTLLLYGNKLNPNKIYQEISAAISFDSTNKFNNLGTIARKVVGEPRQLSFWAQIPREEFETSVVPGIKKEIEKQINIFMKLQVLKRAGIEPIN